MKIYGVSVVRNEADVIAEGLRWASRFCERIRVWDVGSTDGTWEILQKLDLPNVSARRQEAMPFINSLRGRVYEEMKNEIEPGSWIYLSDPDEYFIGRPEPILEAAEREGAGIVGAWQVNFFPTGKDLERLRSIGEESWESIPLAQRLRHYRLEWFEQRFIRIMTGFQWDTSRVYSVVTDGSGRKLKLGRPFGFVRHYRYRSPSQVRTRYETRQGREGIGDGMFRWTSSGDFASYVQPRRSLCFWPLDEAELRVPWYELQRARIAWFLARAVHHFQRKMRLQSAALDVQKNAGRG